MSGHSCTPSRRCSTASASPDPGQGQRAGYERAIALALEDGDEAGAIRAMRELAAIDRSAVRTVDWSAASSG